MICRSQVYRNDENYVVFVENFTPQWERWCLSDFKWDQINASFAENGIMLSKTSVKQLTIDIFSIENISFTSINRIPCLSPRIVSQFKGVVLLHGSDIEVIITESEEYQFLTCYTEPYISFYFYFTPFQAELWMVLRISIATIIAVTTIVLNYQKDKQIFSVWLFVLATLFEETPLMPSRIENATFFRISLGIWCIMSIILTNCYNGIMILELNAPRTLFHPDNFDHLRCQHQFDNMVEFHRKYGTLSTFEMSKQEGYSNFKKRHDAFKAFFDKVFNLSPLLGLPLDGLDTNFTNVDDRGCSESNAYIQGYQFAPNSK
ncbi:Glutamate receptor 2.5 [Folsomia candida]|uniref:Glutamate receptor 2.5 n=1 Tax=Folsomia candida TaxID=158441 RepID=A0A226DVE8_FOLCA|nr:Glutamate receptor 2.5 [Folsomia candida]